MQINTDGKHRELGTSPTITGTRRLTYYIRAVRSTYITEALSGTYCRARCLWSTICIYRCCPIYVGTYFKVALSIIHTYIIEALSILAHLKKGKKLKRQYQYYDTYCRSSLYTLGSCMQRSKRMQIIQWVMNVVKGLECKAAGKVNNSTLSVCVSVSPPRTNWTGWAAN